jgi:thiamine kinase-like enzyme
VNGIELQPVEDILNAIPWDIICKGNPSFFHGDFHFDHILFDSKRETFRLLDWRQDFGGYAEFGDTYYDLAKFCGGLRLNYDYIKEGRFTYSESGDDVVFTFDRRQEGDVYEERFHSFIEEQGYSLEIVKLLVPIIFLNMAPLHHYPFDKLLFALGCSTLQRELGDTIISSREVDRAPNVDGRTGIVLR